MGEPSSTGAPSSVATAASSVRGGFSKKKEQGSVNVALDGQKNTPRVAPPLGVWGAVGRSRDTQKTPWGVVGRSRGASAAYHRPRRIRSLTKLAKLALIERL